MRVAKAYPCHYSKTGIAFALPDGDGCSCRPMRVTKYQLAMLRRLARGENEHAPGHLRRHTTITVNRLVAMRLISRIENDDAKRADEGDQDQGYALTHAGEMAARSGPR